MRIVIEELRKEYDAVFILAADDSESTTREWENFTWDSGDLLIIHKPKKGQWTLCTNCKR